MKIAFLGLSITSSWGNGHATTYRALLGALHARGHEVVFFERDRPWYRDNRDLPAPPFARTIVYGRLGALDAHESEIRDADVVVVGSFVPDGVEIAEWVVRTARGITAFYDIDTPVTLGKLARGEHDYLTPTLVPRFDLYLSFTAGPTLERLERRFGARMARALHCSVDPAAYHPDERDGAPRWALGYLGTYSDDRQPTLERLLLEPARRTPDARFVCAGPQYPASIAWPANVDRVVHLSPREHRAFYVAQRFALNVTRADMVQAGWSPSVRLFEAAACGVPIVSDAWEGLDRFFRPGEEILIARDAAEVTAILRDVSPARARAIGAAARARVLAEHTADVRAAQLEALVREAEGRRRGPARPASNGRAARDVARGA